MSSGNGATVVKNDVAIYKLNRFYFFTVLGNPIVIMGYCLKG